MRLIGIGTPAASMKPVISSALKRSSSQCAPAVPEPKSCSIGIDVAPAVPLSVRYSRSAFVPM